MTENKRFVLYEHKGAEYILDTPNTELDFIEMLGDCLDEKEIVDLLNQLSEENEQLKQFLKKRCPMCRCNLELFYEDAKKLNELQLGVKNQIP